MQPCIYYEYKITKESLLELAKKIYEEGCCGYMDLADSISEKMVNDFIKNKNKISSVTEASGNRREYNSAITNAINSHYVNPPAIPASLHERVAENIAERVLNGSAWSTQNNVTWTANTYHPVWAAGVDVAHLNSQSADVLWHPTPQLATDSIRPETIIRNDVQLRNE